MVFPEQFLWGVSVSGFQFEMGDPAGRNIDSNTDWYVWTRDPLNIQKGVVSGDMPDDGVNYWDLYKRDHRIAEKLGLNAYRIGIEWSRLFPKSTFLIKVGVKKASDGSIVKIEVDDSLEKLDEAANKDALNHYRAVIKDLRARNFKVFVCLNHFTLPLWVHNPISVRDTKLRKGPKGWVNEETIIEFAKYAAYVAFKLGDVVDKWITFNEPMVVPETGYTIPESGFPPGLKNNFKALKKAAINMTIAHARAYDIIKRMDTFKADEDSFFPAEVGLIQNVIPISPLTERDSDIKAAQFMDHMHNHFFLHSITDGWIDENFNGVKERGEEKSYIKQRLDWLGVNYYSRLKVKGRKSALARIFAGIPVIPDIVPDYGFAGQPKSTSIAGKPNSDSGWEIYPEGILDALNAMLRYGRPLYIMENGIADARDVLRSHFIIDHLKILDRAINEEKVDIRGYFHWSLTDNYEWAEGYRMKFGLYSVDLETKKRRSRKSAKNYKRIIKSRLAE